MADDTGEIGREAAEATEFRKINDTVVTSGGPAYWTNLMMSNAAVQQQSMYQISNAITGKIAEMIMNTSPSEGASDATMQSIMNRLSAMTPSPGPAAAPAGPAE